MKKISIVVPIYNMEDKIKSFIYMLTQQSYKNLEIILVDDGSIDSTYEKCRNLQRKESRIKVYHQENKGSGSARNLGISKATGEYIYFPDVDDLIHKNTIEILAHEMSNNEVDMIVFGYENLSVDSSLINKKKYPMKKVSGQSIRTNFHEYFSPEQELYIQGAPWNKFFKLNIIRENNILFPDLRRHQDEIFISRYISYCKDVLFHPEILYTYYTNDIKKIWDKYPINYADLVIEFSKLRKEIILNWNKDNENIKYKINDEYICKCIKALELTFSSKLNINYKSRKERILHIIDKTELSLLTIQDEKYMYQKTVIKLINIKMYNLLYLLIWIKVLIESRSYTIYKFFRQNSK